MRAHGTHNKAMTIDQRLEFLVQSTESLHGPVAAVVERIDKLTAQSERHEREIERFRRAMRAALEAWLSENGDGSEA